MIAEQNLPVNLTIPQAVLLSGISDNQLRQLVNDGKVIAFRPSPRRTLINRESLERFLESTKVHPKAV